MLQLVIPAYNEQDRLPRTLRELRRYLRDQRSMARPVEVIVVDNASTDGTAAVARAADSPALRVRVVECLTPGKGAAVRAGIAVTDAPVVGFMDADGATRLDALEEACRRLALGADVAIGSRGAEGAHTETRHSWVRERGARTYRACTARRGPRRGRHPVRLQADGRRPRPPGLRRPAHHRLLLRRRGAGPGPGRSAPGSTSSR